MKVFVFFTALVAMAFGLPTFPWETIPELRTEVVTHQIPLSTELLSKRVVDCTHEELMTVITTTLHTTVTTMVPEKCMDLVMARVITGFVKHLAYNHLDTLFRLMHTNTVEELLVMMSTATLTTTTMKMPNLETLKPLFVHKEFTMMFEMIKKTYLHMIETNFGSVLADKLLVAFPLEHPFRALVHLPTEVINIKTMTVAHMVTVFKTTVLPLVIVADVTKCPMTTVNTLGMTTMLKTFVTSLNSLTMETMFTLWPEYKVIFPMELKPLMETLLTVMKTTVPFEPIVSLLEESIDVTMLINPLTNIIAKLMTNVWTNSMMVTSSMETLWTTHHMDLVTLTTTMKTMETREADDLLTHFLTRLAIRFQSLGITTTELENIMITVMHELVGHRMEATTVPWISRIDNLTFGMEMKKLLKNMVVML